MMRSSLLLLVAISFAVVLAIATSSEVLEGSYYGYDDEQARAPSQTENVTGQPGGTGNGRRGHHQRGRHNGQHRRQHAANVTWTDEQKLTHICAHIVNPSRGSGSGASGRMSRRQGRYHGSGMATKLQMMSPENQQKVNEMWERRKQDMRRCCQEDSIDQKTQCVNEVRLSRYGRVCLGEEPLCPWAAFMPAHPGTGSSTLTTANTTTTCCGRQGSERLDCFSAARLEYKRQYERMKANGHGHGSHEHRHGAESEATRGGERGRRGGNGRRQRPEGGN